jgi:pyruvate ferredoxin oxidoreductase beta subunit
VVSGKQQPRKDLTAVILAHNVPYVAQASVSHPMDFMRKVARALEIDGPTFINILQPCHRGWGCKPEDSIELARVAVETRWWPLYEVDHGQWKINHRPKDVLPVVDWFKAQDRFKHLVADDRDGLLAWHQAEVDRTWTQLLEKEQKST